MNPVRRLLAILMLLSLTAALWFLASIDPARAQDEQPGEEVIELDAVEVVGEKLPPDSSNPVPIDVSAGSSLVELVHDATAVTVIDAAELGGAASVAEVLERVPGLDVRSQGGAGQISVAQLRGATADQTLVLLDGEPISPGQATDLSSLPAGFIQRVEVLRGPEAARFGAGAMGGVINIVTDGSGNGDDESDSSYADVSIGSFDLHNEQLGGEGNGITWQFSNLAATNDFPFHRQGGAPAMRENNEVSQQQFWLKWGDEPCDDATHWRLGLSRMRRGVPGSAEFPTFQAQLARENALLQASEPGWHADLSASHSHFTDPAPYLQSGPIDAEDTRLHAAVSMGALALADSHWGWRPRLDWIDSGQYGQHSRAGLEASWFGESRHGDWTQQYELGVTASSDIGADPVARYGASLEFGNDSSVYASAGYAVRHPDFGELYLTNTGSVQGNPDLAPERVMNLELGYRTKLASTTVEAATFYSAYQDSIIFAPVSAYLVKAINTGRATVAGAELQLDVPLFDSYCLCCGHGSRLVWRNSATWLPLAELDSGLPLPGRAEEHVSSSLELTAADFSAAVRADYTGSMAADLFGNLVIEPRTVFGLDLWHMVGSGELGLSISNALDASARDSWNYPLPGREINLNWRHEL